MTREEIILKFALAITSNYAFSNYENAAIINDATALADLFIAKTKTSVPPIEAAPTPNPILRDFFKKDER